MIFIAERTSSQVSCFDAHRDKTTTIVMGRHRRLSRRAMAMKLICFPIGPRACTVTGPSGMLHKYQPDLGYRWIA